MSKFFSNFFFLNKYAPWYTQFRNYALFETRGNEMLTFSKC
jgi:hypothetical protein